MEVVVATEAIRRAKLQSKCDHYASVQSLFIYLFIYLFIMKVVPKVQYNSM